VLGCPFFGLQLFSSINPIVFRPNNYIISIFWAMDSMWVSFGVWALNFGLWAFEIVSKHFRNGPKLFIG
jgi:hypothetical protein